MKTEKLILKRAKLLVFLLMMTSLSFGQQLDGILKKKPLEVTGGFGVNQNLYLASGVQGRFVPYSLIATGNINFSFYGFNVPFSFSYTTQKFDYQTPQPFNIVGLSPSYKNLTLHAGYRNMTFSPYTLAGHNYLGGGVEYQFKKVKVMAMGGRLKEAVDYDTTQLRNVVGYARYGGGAKVTYTNDGNELSFITFYATDQESSIGAIPDNLGINPEENHVYSVGFKKKLNKVVSFNFEGAASGWNKDKRNEAQAEQEFYEKLFYLEANNATVFYTAFKTGLNLAFEKGSLGTNFERVAPEYKTLGAYFMNSDFQNLTLNLQRRFLKNKLSFNANGGFQRDDLNNTKQTRMNRFVGSINSAMNFSKRFKVNAGYSNFNSFINVKPVDQAFVQNSIYDQIDTLNFQQVNQTSNASINWIPMENDNILHSVNVNGNFSASNNNNSGETIATKLFSSSLGYSTNFKKSGVGISASLNGNRNIFQTGTSTFIGGGANSSFTLFKKKLKVSLGTNISSNYEGDQRVGLLYTASNNYSMSIGKKQSVALNLRYSGRRATQTSQFSTINDTFNEFTGNLNYSFRF